MPDISIRIGGAAGQGMNVISTLLGKALLRSSYFVFINHDVMSRIRGGNNFSQVRLCDKPVKNSASMVDILLCLDKNTAEIHKDKLNSIVLYDQSQKIEVPPDAAGRYIQVPLEEIAKNTGKNPKMSNTVAVGALAALLKFEPDKLYELLDEIFLSKGKEVADANKNCLKAGYDFVNSNYAGKFNFNLGRIEQKKGMMLVTGSEAIALGALAAGIKFYCAYPMSPSTAILEYLAKRQKECGFIVEQAEDEIAAINMALGASFTGARSMTGTSGGGMALMVEGISLSGMTETPVVIVDGQRPAPATGFPTRTEQGDLLYAAFAGHGEFPRVILAPSSAEDAFYLTQKAFYLAEKYHIPVFILSDQYINDSSWTVEKFDIMDEYSRPQGFLNQESLNKLGPYAYKRYEITDSGVTPRIIPGTQNQVLYADSDEHTEEGHITESGTVRNQMVEKRLRKFLGIIKEISLPEIYPGTNCANYVISWGSTKGVAREAVDSLRNKGADTGYIHFTEIFPLNRDFFSGQIFKKTRLIDVENNATGQFAKLIEMETGIEVKDRILKYDGRPFDPQDLADRIKKVI